MESIQKIFDELINMLIAIDSRGELSKEESSHFHHLVTIYWMYYIDSFWGDKE